MGLAGKSRYYTFGRFCIDTQNDTLSKDGHAVSITHKSFEILLFLAQNPGKMLSKNDFFEIVWSESHVDETNLTQHIYRIRKIIENTDSKDIYIETIPKFGYRFVANVESIETTPVHQNGNGKPSFNADKNDTEKLLGSQGNLTGSEIITYEKLDTDDEHEFPKMNFSSYRETKQSNQRWSFVNLKLVLVFIFGALLCFVSMQAFYRADFLAAASETKDLTVAVLPFTQIGNTSDSNLELGLADTIISKVSGLQGVSASPTEVIAAYTKQNPDFHQKSHYDVGAALDVDVVLTGTIQREDDVIRVNMRVYHVSEKRHICSIKFDEVDKGAFPLQDAISERVRQKFIADLNAHKIAKDGIRFE